MREYGKSHYDPSLRRPGQPLPAWVQPGVLALINVPGLSCGRVGLVVVVANPSSSWCRVLVGGNVHSFVGRDLLEVRNESR